MTPKNILIASVAATLTYLAGLLTPPPGPVFTAPVGTWEDLRHETPAAVHE